MLASFSGVKIEKSARISSKIAMSSVPCKTSICAGATGQQTITCANSVKNPTHVLGDSINGPPECLLYGVSLLHWPHRTEVRY